MQHIRHALLFTVSEILDMRLVVRIIVKEHG